MSDTKTLLAICGSLRKDSLNRALMNACAELLPEGWTLKESPSVGGLPLYNSDEDPGDLLGGPEPVAAFKKAVHDADAVLFVSPEYNYSVPGVLKNAIDWASRPGFKSVFAGKPTYVIGASMGGTGTVRMQVHLRQILYGLLANVFPNNEVLVSAAHTKFADGQLTDEATREFLTKTLQKFTAWVDA